jgi:hypothetical protein
MKKASVFLVVMMAVLMVFNITGCRELAAEDMIAKANDSINTATSMDVKMTLDINMQLGGVNQPMETEIEASAFMDPLKFKSITKMGGQTMYETYAEKSDDKIILYVGMDGQWAKQEMSVEEFNTDSSGNYQENAQLYLESMQSFEAAEETQTVNGVEAVKITGKITGEDIKKVMEASGSLEGMDEMAGGDDALNSLMNDIFENMGDISVAVWLDHKTYTPVRFELDMTECISSLFTAVFANMGITEDMIKVDSAISKMDISNLNSATEFEIPEAAKNAQ